MEESPYSKFQHALGVFITQYAQLEAVMQITLWHYAGVSPKIGAALFSGTRTDAAIKLIRRVMDVTIPSPEQRADLEDVFSQINLINEVRNHLMHYGAQGFADSDIGTVSNSLIAIDEKRLVEIPISAAIMHDMSVDLEKIKAHLMLRHVARGNLPPDALKAFEPTLLAPWRYKQPPKQQRATNKPGRPSQAKG